MLDGPQHVEFVHYAARPGDPDFADANHGGCWFCFRQNDDLAFDTEFDTYVHLKCIRIALDRPSKMGRREAEIMSYLLE